MGVEVRLYEILRLEAFRSMVGPERD